MKAVVCERYGSPEWLRLRELEPPEPGPDQVRVRVRATTATPSDVLICSGRFPWYLWLPTRLAFGVTRPRDLIPGYEIAGEVESVGSAVTRFAVGDRVWGCSYWRFGGCAEYVCLPESAPLALMPEHWSFAEAASLCDGPSTALHFLSRGGLREHQHVLVHGASGSIGTAAVQVAKHLGADITAVCSGANADLVKSLGADRVIDYTREDFGEGGDLYDVIFDAVGQCPFATAIDSLAPEGTYVSTRLKPGHALRGRWIAWTTRKRVRGGLTMTRAKTLERIRDLVDSGALRPVIDRRVPLEDLAAAHGYVATGHKRGCVVVLIDADADADADA